MQYPRFDYTWSLFLDRDGVLNHRIPGDYVKYPEELVLLPGVPEAVARLSAIFGRLLIVTNQAGIGKGLMDEAQLYAVHTRLLEQLREAGGRIDAIYFCPALATDDAPCRKPGTGMGLQAKADFPAIDFSRSVIAGDSGSDMEFGRRLGMVTVLIETKLEEKEQLADQSVHYRFGSLYDFAAALPIAWTDLPDTPAPGGQQPGFLNP